MVVAEQEDDVGAALLRLKTGGSGASREPIAASPIHGYMPENATVTKEL
jgi:hypothetical protein